MPAIPTLKPITRRLPASTLHTLDLDEDINAYLPLQLRDPNPRPRGGGGGGHSSSTSHGSSSSSSHGSISSSSSSSSSKDKSHKSKKGSSSTTVVVLPVWAIILIVVLVFETMLFCVALGWFCHQAKAERKLLHPKKPRPQLNYSRIWWNAFVIASWLWIPIAIYNLIMERVIEPRKGVKKERKVFRPLVDGSSSKVDSATVSTPYKGTGVGAGAGQDPELTAIKETNSACSKIPSGTEVAVEEVKMKSDSPEDVKTPFEEKKEETESAAPPYPSGAFAGYAPAPVPAPVSPIVAHDPAEPQQGAAASYFAMSQPQNQHQHQQEQEQQGAAASYFSSYAGTQSQGLPSTNPWGKQ